MKLILILVIAALSIPMLAQSNGKAEVFSAKDIQAQLASLGQKAQTSGSSGTSLGNYQSHSINLSVRTKSGGAEVHGHFDDVMIVTKGTATLITGGTVVDPKTKDNGETLGTSIKDGESHTISVGDVIHVPAGTPHQLIVPEGTEYSAMVVKVHEP